MPANARNRRTDQERFLDKLSELSEQRGPPIGNITMREALGWGEKKYARVKHRAEQKGKISSGRGRGGSISLIDTTPQKLKIFISYCHVDELQKEEMLKHLKPLKDMVLIDVWDDRKITAGKNFPAEINENLETADIILLIISIDFINSSYCHAVEMEKALERQKNGKARVIPIILRNCMWKNGPFAELLALPKNGRPVMSWPSVDDAYVDIAQGIKKVVDELRAS